MEISFVYATAVNVDDYIRIVSSQFSRTYRAIIDPEKVAADFVNKTVYMICGDGRPAGCLMYHIYDDFAIIDELAILRGFEGRGFGTIALEFALEELKAIDLIKLVTHPENPAKRLYEHFGFRETGTRIENYWDSGEPRIEMARVRS